MSEDPNVWREVFSPLGQAMAVFGGLGGLVKALVQRLDWRETARVVIVGAGTAFGVGVLSPYILSAVLGIDVPNEVRGLIGILCASAFVVGVVAVALVEYLIQKAAKGSGGGRNEDPSTDQA